MEPEMLLQVAILGLLEDKKIHVTEVYKLLGELEQRDKTIAALRSDRDIYKTANHMSELDRLRFVAQNELMLSALEFYARPEAYNGTTPYKQITDDRGNRARDTIAQVKALRDSPQKGERILQ